MRLEPSRQLAQVQGRDWSPPSGIPTNPFTHVVGESDIRAPCQKHADHFMCLCSAAQMMGVHPPLSWGAGKGPAHTESRLHHP